MSDVLMPAPRIRRKLCKDGKLEFKLLSELECEYDEGDAIFDDLCDRVFAHAKRNKRWLRFREFDYRDLRSKSTYSQTRALAGFMQANDFSFDEFAEYAWYSRFDLGIPANELAAITIEGAWGAYVDLKWFRSGPVGSVSADEIAAIRNGVEVFADDDPPHSIPRFRSEDGKPAFKSIGDFIAAREPVVSVVEPFLPSGTVTTITAVTGAGKTALFAMMALAVTTGRTNVLGLEVAKGRVAYATFENPDDASKRLEIAAKHLTIDLGQLGDRLVVIDQRVSPETLVAMLAEESEAGGFALVLLDTLAAAFDGADMNSAVEGGEFIRRLRPITQLPGKPALLIASHPVKGSAPEMLVPYGSGAILNEVDANLSLRESRDRSGTTLHWAGKFRGLKFAPIPFMFQIVDSADVVDSKGRRLALPVLRPCGIDDRFEDPADAVATPTISASPVDSDALVRRELARNPRATVDEIAAATGLSRATAGRRATEIRPAIIKTANKRLTKFSGGFGGRKT